MSNASWPVSGSEGEGGDEVDGPGRVVEQVGQRHLANLEAVRIPQGVRGAEDPANRARGQRQNTVDQTARVTHISHLLSHLWPDQRLGLWLEGEKTVGRGDENATLQGWSR